MTHADLNAALDVARNRIASIEGEAHAHPRDCRCVRIVELVRLEFAWMRRGAAILRALRGSSGSWRIG